VGGGYARPQVGALVEQVRVRLQPDAAGDRLALPAIIHRRRPQHGRHAALAIVEIGLQQRGRFPAFMLA
jgi:hypothetical protein